MALRMALRLRDFCADQSGTIAVVTGLCATALIGFAALAVDVASWQTAQHSMQGAADSAAYSAGVAYNNIGSTAITTQAKAIAASYGYVDGQNGVTVTVNQPPASGSHTSSSTAVEVIVQQPQPRFLSGLFLGSNPTVNARAVATTASPACILALDPTASQAVTFSGGSTFNSPNCDVASNSNSSSSIYMSGSSTVTTPCLVSVGTDSVTSGLTLTKCSSATTGAPASADPYASVPAPTHSGSCLQPVTSGNNLTFSPGYYCGNTLQFSGSQVATFQAGTYYVGGNFKFTGSSTATGTGVTFFIASPNSVDFGGNRTASFTAPTSGTYAGIAFFGDRAGTANNNNIFNGGGNTTITGAIYFPTESVTFSGGSSSGSGDCTQIIADTISVTGNAHFNSACQGDGMTEVEVHSRSAGTVQIVE
jgi:Flp pilus assembly protein TadG